MEKRISNIVMLPNLSKNIFCQRIESVANRFIELGCRIGVSKEYTKEYGIPKNCYEFEPESCECDAFLVLGGDGSMIEAAHYTMGTRIPVVGMNFGHLGYLTELAEDDSEELKKLVLGEYEVDERMMLTAEICDGYGNVRTSFTVLNDIVLNNGPVSRMISFDLFADGVKVQTLRADGLIAATPTGSTAYSLSAGGPVIDPRLRGICVTPICAHSLGIRPIVFGEDSQIRILNFYRNSSSVFINADGRDVAEIEEGDVINIRKSSEVFRLIRLRPYGFLSVLDRKLSGRS